MAKLRMRKNALLNRSDAKNIHQLGLRARVAVNTAYKYNSGEDIRLIDLDVLSAMLLDGVGITKTQALDLRLGDLFEFVD